MTPIEFVRRLIPEPINDDFANYILWTHTGYPSFFMGDPIRTMAKQIRGFWRAYKQGCSICCKCGRKFEVKKYLDDICPKCNKEVESLGNFLGR